MKKTIFFILSVASLLSLFGCTEEEDLFDDNFEEQVLQESSLVLDFLNQEFINSGQVSSNFEINFPITLTTNTGTVIDITNGQGLREFATSLTSDFYATGLSLPIVISNTTINNLSDLRQKLTRCGIPTFRSVISQSFNSCFDFNYPLNLIDSNSDIQAVQNQDEYNSFVASQGGGYEPKIEYPITIVSNIGSVVVNNNFDFYQVINSCDRNCNEFRLNTQSNDDSNSVVVFSIENLTDNNIQSIKWFKDGELIVGEEGMILLLQFPESGDFEICAEAQFDNCLVTRTICANITSEVPVNDGCHDFSIDFAPQTITTPTIFRVNSDFINEISNVNWLVNGEEFLDENEVEFRARFIDEGGVLIVAEVTFENCSAVLISDFLFVEIEASQLGPCDVIDISANFNDQNNLNLVEFAINQEFLDNIPGVTFEWELNGVIQQGVTGPVFTNEFLNQNGLIHEICVSITGANTCTENGNLSYCVEYNSADSTLNELNVRIND